MRKINHLMSKKILALILDDFSFFGSIPFFAFATFVVYLTGNLILFERLAYCFVISLIVVIGIKSAHFKDRPQKEEFSIFMEKVLASSFPSSHSIGVTILAILFYLAYPLIHVLIAGIIISILVYMQRYITKKHFVIDIMGGIIIAIVETVFVIKVF